MLSPALKSVSWQERSIALAIVIALHIGFLALLRIEPAMKTSEPRVSVQVVLTPKPQRKSEVPVSVELQLRSPPPPQVSAPELSIESPVMPTVSQDPSPSTSSAPTALSGGSGRDVTSSSLPGAWTTCTNRLMPLYPSDAKLYGLEGKVTLLVPLDEKGVIGDVEIIRSSGSRSLDRAAIMAVKRWKCSPVLDQGRAVRAITKQEIEFTMPGRRSNR